MVTIGFNTRSIGEERTAREAVDFAVEHGIRAVELDGRGGWHQRLSPDDIRHMKAQGAAHGIQYSIHFAQATSPASHDPERRAKHLQELRDDMDLVHDLGGRVIVVHLGQIDHPGTQPAWASEAVRREATENAVEFLQKAAPTAQDTGVALAVENLLHRPGDVTQTYDELVNVVRRVDSPVVGITLDTGHAVLTDGLDAAISAFQPYLRHLHIHDCVGQEDHHEIGKGSLDLGRYAHILREAPLTLTMEVGRGAVLAMEAGQDPKGMVLRSRDRVKAMLGDLAH